MRSKSGKKQSNKLIKYILRAPIAVFRKVREFCIENLSAAGCGGKTGQSRDGGIFSSVVPRCHMRRSFSTSENRMRNEDNDDEDEDLKYLLIRAAFGEIDLNNRSLVVRKKGLTFRSYSVRVGRIGRIDEDEPCNFMEVDTSMFIFSNWTDTIITSHHAQP